MSADNGYVIQRTASGQYTLQMFFASTESYPDPEQAPESSRFDTLLGAVYRYEEMERESGFVCEYGLTFNIDKESTTASFDLRDAVPFNTVIAKDAMIPTKDIPVHAQVNGRKMRVGTAHVNPETMIVTTKLDDDNEAAKIWLNSVRQMTGPGMLRCGLVSISELTFRTEVVDGEAVDERN